jgi:autotransporter adhesin
MKKRSTLAFPYPRVNLPAAAVAGMLALCACSGTNALADTLNTVQGCGGAAGPGTTIARDFVPIPTSEAIDGSGQFSLTAGCNASGSGQLAAVAFGSYAVVTGAAGVAMGVSTVAAKWAAAYGVDAAATGTGSIALGAGSVATALNSVSIGSGAGDGITFHSVADSTQATAAGAIAIGANATRGAQAFAADTIAIGGQATAGAAASNAVAIGRGANVTVANGLALGNGASATATNSVALGSGSTTAAPHTGVTSRFGASVAGTASAANGTVSLGAAGAERQVQNVAAGVLSATSTDAINGSQLFAVAAGVDSVGTSVAGSLGGGAAYNPANGTMSGFSVPLTAVGTNGAVGVSTPATTVGSALGTLNTSVGNTANIAVKYGTSGSAPDYSSVVMAGAVSTDGGVTGGTRLSNLSRGALSATSTDAVNGSQLFAANQQVSQNTTNIAGNTSSIASLGTRVDGIYTAGTKYFHATSSEIDSQASGLDSIAIGPSAAATEDGDIAIGLGAVTLGGNSIAIGPAAIAMNPNSVALGMGSFTSSANPVPSGTVAGKTVTYAGGAPTSVVSVGSASDQRQIINVAAGRVTASSTDAINGSQLFATNEAINTLAADASTAVAAAVKYDQTGGAADYTRMTLAGPVSTDGGVTGGTRISNLSQGALSATSTDAVNGSQLFATNQQVDQNTANIAGNTSSITALGTRVDGVFDNGTKYFHANSTGADSQPIGVDSVAIGPTAIANNAGDVALGAGAVTAAGNPVSGATIGGTPFVFAGGAPASVVSVGSPGNERQITNVAAGRITSVSTDAINGSQLFATNEVLDTLVATTSATALGTVKYDQAGGAPDYTRMTLAGPASTDGGVTGGTRISNLSQGALSATSTDAVNGSQLFATNQKVDQNTANITDLGNQVSSYFSTGTKYFHTNSTGADSQAVGLDSIAIGPTAVAAGVGAIAIGGGSQASQTGDVALGVGATANRGAANYTGKYSGASNTAVGTVAVGSAGAERTVSHVADGQQATDAVNVRQLDGAVNQANQYTDARIAAIDTSAVVVDQKLTEFSNRVGTVEGNVQTLRNGTSGLLQVSQSSAVLPAPSATGNNAMAVGVGATASGDDSTAIGNGASASGAGSYAVGNGATASGNKSAAAGNNAAASAANSTAVGNSATASAANSVAVGSGSIADRADSVSVGSIGNERQITNVAPGTSDTDAANVGQLRAVEGSMSGQLSRLRNDIDSNDNRASAGVATAMAMASLPQAYLPGRSMMSMGGGAWRGESGMAIGLSTVSDSGRWVVKGAVSSSSRGDYGGAVGVGYQW